MMSRGPIAPRAVAAALPDQSLDSSSPVSSVTSIVTSREWVLPPRPKPGRKPSVDTPASKRKAQNRAAQRAFRERRATRVQELEAKLLEVEKEKEIKEMGLVNTINKLKFENLFLLKSVDQLKADFASLRQSLPQGQSLSQPHHSHQPHHSPLHQPHHSHQPHHLRDDVSQSAHHLLSFAKSSPANTAESPASLLYSVQQILPAPSADSPPSLFKPREYKESVHGDKDFDCGVCLKEQCLCVDIGIKDSKSSSISEVAKIKPMPAVSLKRPRKEPTRAEETDFTDEFAVKKMPDLKKLKKPAVKTEIPESTGSGNPGSASAFNEDSPLENCGFCSDDTPCVCREAAKEAARLNESLAERPSENGNEPEPTSLPPLLNSSMRKASLPVMHPGPTLEIREFTNLAPGAVPTVVTKNNPADNQPEKPEMASTSPQQQLGEKDGCTGNPGTCSQCQTDPMSTLFCTTVASRANDDESKSATPSEKPPVDPPVPMVSRPPSIVALTNPLTPLPTTPGGSTSGIFIPCADAYRTLSRHKRFNSVDFTALVGKLTTRGMQVEVQSVANVLRELDRKVYD